MQSRTLLILTLLLYLSQNVISQGVTPIQRSPDFSHFNAGNILSKKFRTYPSRSLDLNRNVRIYKYSQQLYYADEFTEGI